jgi:hypothetical protein
MQKRPYPPQHPSPASCTQLTRQSPSTPRSAVRVDVSGRWKARRGMDRTYYIAANLRHNGSDIETWFDANSDRSRKFLLFPGWRRPPRRLRRRSHKNALRPVVGLIGSSPRRRRRSGVPTSLSHFRAVTSKCGKNSGKTFAATNWSLSRTTQPPERSMPTGSVLIASSQTSATLASQKQ